MRKTKQTPGVAALVLKALAVLLAGVLLVEMLIFTVASVSGVDGDVTDAELISWCEEDYYARDFAGLYDTLTLFDLYGEGFDLYREVTGGYIILQEYEQWLRAAEQGMDGAPEKAASALARLEALANAPDHGRNASLLQGFLAKAYALAD